MMNRTILQDRLRLVVDVVFAGSSHAAAKASGVEPSTLHRLLDGTVTDPRMATVRALAESFGLPLGWITGDMSTSEAQRGESSLPESYWLLAEYHGRRRRAAKASLDQQQAPKPARISENIPENNYLPDFRLSMNSQVPKLLNSLPIESKQRIDFERRFLELETELIEAVAEVVGRVK